ncbi:MAG: MBL fold metallo-hydrolase [Sandaracinaceae bacterium]|jgi:glyoxylase-like metal-dependent hydrolase (beta-lactamase superfamily II)|nr:MBL fold metallo-hydrolase [Sandaracinaceae bacterium]
MRVQPFFDPRTFTLSYVVFDEETRDAVAIDPVLDYEPVGSSTHTESIDQLSDFVRKEKLRLHYTLETHAHADHLSAAQLLRRRFDARVVIGASITEVQATFKDVLSLAHLATDGSQFDVLLDDGETLQAGSLSIKALATPGHTPACLTYEIGGALFTGDLLFMDDYGTGRCDFPKGSAAQMYDSIQKLYRYPDATKVYPGHDYPPASRTWKHETTIGASKDHNPQLRADTSKEAFVSMRQARDKTLAAPRLLFPSVQVNIDAGRMPPVTNGKRYLVTPINLFQKADELGEPSEPARSAA